MLSVHLRSAKRAALARSSSRLPSTVSLLQSSQRPSHGEPSLLYGAVRTKASIAAAEPFASGTASHYVEEMYEAWQKDPSSVHVSWASYFKNVDGKVPLGRAYNAPPTLVPPLHGRPEFEGSAAAEGLAMGGDETGGNHNVLDHIKVQLLIRAYQVRGHQLANLDPLDINNIHLGKEIPPELDPKTYGFVDADYERSFSVGTQGMLPGFRGENGPTKMTLRDIVKSLQDTYASTIGIEYHHIPSRQQCDWIRQRLEVPQKFKYTQQEKKMILDRLIWSDSFERFVAAKWTSEKRFGLEGCEALIPGMKALIDRSVDFGVQSINIGMPHRGRLNVLSNVVRKANESIFSEFYGNLSGTGEEGSGDVKYHLGANYERPTPNGKRVALSLLANPSHLEAVNPVVEGKTRAQQFYKGDETERSSAMSIVLHGDAAFAAQGVVYETLGFADLPSYATGGTVHIIVNNQIGFTTDPRFARSTPYCTDVAKTINAPILHVNADDVESVVFACDFAAEWRKTFHKSIVLDLVCYRRHGHNEVDQPAFTQPRMYQTIAKKPTVLSIYADKLIAEGSISKEEIEANKQQVWEMLEASYGKSKDYKSQPKEWVSSVWHGFMSPKELAARVVPTYDTGIPVTDLQRLGEKLTTLPSDFNIHPLLGKILKTRAKTVSEGEGIDWATAESLAWGSLLQEGIHCRLSGQDVERGTFSHRHAVLNDQKNEAKYTPLNHVSEDQADISICNSSLSEYGTLGFELGYSLVDPRSLIMWEAQFGDFVNNAQCIIDQFIASGETKWVQRTGLTLMLPHGYDGAGPEHSSGRMERFLELCDDHPFELPSLEEGKNRQIQDCNMQIVYATTPANYFHVLRRQIKRDFRKPLILFNSKQILRHPLAKSSLADLADGTRFLPLIPDARFTKEGHAVDRVKRVIFCSGQVYYTLFKARQANGLEDVVALNRVEQISPFPYKEIIEEASRYPNAEEVIWTQEEPLNFGAWWYASPRLETALKHASGPLQNQRPLVVSREPNAAVATGQKKMHVKEEQQLTSEALFGKVFSVKEVQAGVPIFASS